MTVVPSEPRCLSEWPQHGPLHSSPSFRSPSPLAPSISNRSGGGSALRPLKLHESPLAPSSGGSQRAFRAPSGLTDDEETDDDEAELRGGERSMHRGRGR